MIPPNNLTDLIDMLKDLKKNEQLKIKITKLINEVKN
jgi:hypothetical protein